MRTFRIAFFCMGLLALGSLWAQVATLKPSLSSKSPYDVSIYPATKLIVNEGFLAYFVEISNTSSDPVSFEVEAQYQARHSSNNANTESSRTDVFTVPAGTKQIFSSQVLTSDSSGVGWGSPSIHFRVSGPTIRGSNAGTVSANYTRNRNQVAFIGFVGGLFAQVGSSLDDPSTRDLLVERFDKAYMPLAATAYTGMDAVAINASIWTDLAPEAREALLDWVTLGGRLILHVASSRDLDQRFLESEFQLKGNAPSVAMGFGEIHRINSKETGVWEKWIDTNIEPNKRQRFSNGQTTWLGEAWEDLIADDPINMNAALVSLFMIAFAVIIGPVNLIKFAPPHKRFRIFITTPIISLVASMILVGVILVGDGVGGSSYQSSLAYLDGDAGKYYVDQRAVVRSSLLFDTKVETDPDKRLMPLLVNEFDRRAANAYDHTGPVHAGDFLSNRRWQGLGSEYVEPTRSTIDVERTDEGAWEVYSSISAQLSEVMYVDELGIYWNVSDLGQGGRKTMSKAEQNTIQRFWLEIEENSSAAHYRDVRRWSRRNRGFFIATTEAVQELPALELPAIIMQDQYLVLCGLVDGEGGIQ
ncbi:MAG: hypothetical protein ACPGN3_02845 [Opitutales bacterium]